MNVELVATAKHPSRIADSAGSCFEDVNDHIAASAARLQTLVWPIQSHSDMELSTKLWIFWTVVVP